MTEPVKYTFVSRIKGSRDIHHLTAADFDAVVAQKMDDADFTLQEHFTGATIVCPFLDYDCKLQATPSEEELPDVTEEHYQRLQTLAGTLFPDRQVLFAQRHGQLHDGQFKISFRAFVRGVKCKVSDIPNYIRKGLSLQPKENHPHVDLSVYKGREQLLGVIFGRKDIEPLTMRRVLRPLDAPDGVRASDYLVQNIEGVTEELIVRKGKEREDGKVKSSPMMGGASPSSREELSTSDHLPVLQAATKLFGEKYIIQEKLASIIIDREKNTLIFPTKRKWCYIKRETHKNNNPCITVSKKGAKFRCPDESCSKQPLTHLPLSELCREIRDLYTQTFYGTVDNNLMREAKDECRRNISDNFPEETPDDVEQVQNTLMTLAKRQICRKCGSSKTRFEHAQNGWCIRCADCRGQWPNTLVPLDTAEYPKLVATLTQLNIAIGSVNITNITNIYNDTLLDFYADFSHDNIIAFEDRQLNDLFIGAFQGTDTSLSRFATEYFKDQFHCTADRKWFHFKPGAHCWSDHAADLTYREALAKPDFLRHFQLAALHFENMPSQSDEVKRKARMLRRLCVNLEDGKQRDKVVTDSVMKFHDRRPTFSDDLNTQNIICFNDGVFCLDTFTFGKGHPDIPVTMNVSQKFIPYDPDHEHTKFLMQFMTDILPDPAVREYTLKVLGICLTLDTSQQYFFVWTGSGGNGKGRLLSLMEECLGVYFQAVSPTFLTRKREDANQANEALMSLRTVRLAVFQEAEASDVLQAGTIKSITGQDTISTRENYGRQIKFKPQFKSLFVCNAIPNVSESTNGLWRRFRVIHFPTSFVQDPKLPHERKIDTDLDRKLKDAAPWFIGVLINYLQRYKEEGLKEPRAVIAATNSYKDSVDVIKEFITERMIADPGSFLHWTEFTAAFNRQYPGNKWKVQELRTQLNLNGVKFEATSTMADGDKLNLRGFKGWKLA